MYGDLYDRQGTEFEKQISLKKQTNISKLVKLNNDFILLKKLKHSLNIKRVRRHAK